MITPVITPANTPVITPVITPVNTPDTGQMVGGVNFKYGYATTTNEGLLGGGTLACGQPGGNPPPGVDALGAIPQQFYSQIGGVAYNPQGVFSCHPKWVDSTTVTPGDLLDKAGNKVCYKLTNEHDTTKKSIIIYPVDTCNGGCIKGFKKGGDCKSINSCMDVTGMWKNPSGEWESGTPPSGISNGTYADQRNKSLRCPPTIMAHNGGIMSKQDIQKKLAEAYLTQKRIECPHTDVTLPGYAKKGGNSGFCDWCGGDNMHFDIQLRDGSSPWKTGTVVRYEMIPCPK